MQTSGISSGMVGGIHGVTIISIVTMWVIIWWRWTKASMSGTRRDTGKRRASAEPRSMAASCSSDRLGSCLCRGWGSVKRTVDHRLPLLPDQRKALLAGLTGHGIFREGHRGTVALPTGRLAYYARQRAWRRAGEHLRGGQVHFFGDSQR
jgi:hypothetical protein